MIYLNGSIIPESKAKISVFDRGFLYGDGVYETLRSYGGIVFMLDEHIRRLFRSASMIGLAIPMGLEGIERAVYSTLSANRLKDAYVRITVSRGKAPLGLDPRLTRKPTFVIMVKPLKEYPRTLYSRGIKLVVAGTRRNIRDALNPQIKSLNFLNNILAKKESVEKGGDEAIMLNHRGYIAEGTVSNVFFVKNSVLRTPSVDMGILDGITRQVILETARDLGIRAVEGAFTLRQLYRSDEVFVSNTTMEVMPVRSVDGRMVGNGAGKITKALLRGYRKRVKQYRGAAIAAGIP